MHTETKNKLKENQYNELSELTYEYEQAMLLTQDLGSKVITIYGGANLKQGTQTYQDIQILATELDKLGWSIITGGGPGVMTAGLAGAKEKGSGKAISFRLRLSGEPPIINGDIDFMFEHFPPRKFALRQANAYIYCPGALGTLDELMENLDLMKTNKMPTKPIYLYGKEYWSGLMDWFETTVIEKWKLASPSQKKLYKIVDSGDEILDDLINI